ncbi:hypothetical protein L484_025688 [Morus notabilis]|uniref:Uncharacterized protein n=1 Tax=Morus notabilis TaxID=981085 RepID=W9RBW6_9ROSA|nr:hypothetical protein L484_025688 [Morus notabilis]
MIAFHVVMIAASGKPSTPCLLDASKSTPTPKKSSTLCSLDVHLFLAVDPSRQLPSPSAFKPTI